MVLLLVLSGLSLRFQRWDLWLRPPSSSLSVVSCLEMRGRLRLRELIRWSEPGSWSLEGRKKLVRRRRREGQTRMTQPCEPAVRVLDVGIGVTFPLRVGQQTLLL